MGVPGRDSQSDKKALPDSNSRKFTLRKLSLASVSSRRISDTISQRKLSTTFHDKRRTEIRGIPNDKHSGGPGAFGSSGFQTKKKIEETPKAKNINIHPKHLRMWDTIMLGLQLFTLLQIPLALFFEEKWCEGSRSSDAMVALLWVVEALYFLDIFVTFFTIRVRGDKFRGIEIVDDNKQIAYEYVSGRFIFDVVALIPVIGLFRECSRGWDSTVLALMKICRLQRSSEIRYRFENVHSVKLTKQLRSGNSYQVLKQVIILLLFTHFIACAFYALGRFNGASGWLEHTETGQGLVGGRLEYTERGQEWIGGDLVLADYPWDKQYLYALYWTMATLATVGYGDINPVADNEKAFSIFVMLFGAVLYASVFGAVTVTLQNLNEDRVRYQEKTADIRRFIHNYRSELPQDLQDRIMDYTDFMWIINKGFDLEHVASSFPLDMSEQIKMAILAGFVYRVDFFKGLAEDFIRNVVMGVRGGACLADDYIYREGHYGFFMVFLRKGEVNLLVTVDGTTTMLDTVKEGGHFGEISWFLEIDRTDTAMAATNCEYYTLDYETFEMACKNHPRYKDQIRVKVKQKLQQDIEDWEEAECGLSSLHMFLGADNIAEKMKIAKHLQTMCDKKAEEDLLDNEAKNRGGSRRRSVLTDSQKRELGTFTRSNSGVPQSPHSPHTAKGPLMS